MPRKPRHPAATMPLMLWNDIALRTAEMLVASAQVIAHRTGRMAKAGPKPSMRDRREFSRMGLEKMEAASESMWAMGQHLAAMNGQVALKAWQDAAAAGTAWMSLAASRTLPQVLQGQVKLARTVSTSAKSAQRLSDAAARMTGKALEPIHSRATANAKRLGSR